MRLKENQTQKNPLQKIHHKRIPRIHSRNPDEDEISEKNATQYAQSTLQKGAAEIQYRSAEQIRKAMRPRPGKWKKRLQSIAETIEILAVCTIQAVRSLYHSITSLVALLIAGGWLSVCILLLSGSIAMLIGIATISHDTEPAHLTDEQLETFLSEMTAPVSEQNTLDTNIQP